MNVYVNGERRELPDTATLADLLAVGRPGSARGVAVAVDGQVVPRVEHAATGLHEGARVEIVTAVQGG